MRIYSVLLFINSVIDNTLTYSTQPPCCRDHLGTPACQRLYKSNSRLFVRKCNTNAEFRLVQCCSTCNRPGMSMAYDLVARSLVSEHCFDRYGKQFCDRYVNSTDIFEPRSWSCDGENPQIAFRACRESCGFCNFSIIHYTLENAQKVGIICEQIEDRNVAIQSCRTKKSTWRDRLLQLKYGGTHNWLLDTDVKDLAQEFRIQ
ncbi:hypothetical protein WR25_16542 [Diploscapter pachys]|uniref:ShKT domain-containing protein n=1 Tax=Diploscapter pachys TaxID=2018661 RepID=A0A2A2JU27_9BILA|nr:hypothetical protein WR25_16542 [Diploscapter pachys]